VASGGANGVAATQIPTHAPSRADGARERRVSQGGWHGATITATPVSDTVGNHSGFAGLFAGLAGALATAAGVGQTPEGLATFENTPLALSSVVRAAIDDGVNAVQ
jgi:hypothetical protein